jgi:hypothetical protein
LSDAPPAPEPARRPTQQCQVFAAEDVYVTMGVNRGEGLGDPDAACPGDVYELAADARPLRLILCREGAAPAAVAGSEIGAEGDTVTPVALYRMMDPEGGRLDLLLLRVGRGPLATLPLAPAIARREYTLLAVEPPPPDVPLADLLCVSFGRGTLITLGDGRQRPIETLVPGDMILTRDHGRQPLRWLGRATLRATGAFAPVVIGKGRMGNAGDLIVSQHHRLFLYQRDRRPGVPMAEILVQACHLVDGETITLREGGFADYFSLVFDRHEIVYAEGIPCESLMVNEATLPRLPAEIAEAVRAHLPGLHQSQHFGTEATRALIAALGPEALLPPVRRRPGKP